MLKNVDKLIMCADALLAKPFGVTAKDGGDAYTSLSNKYVGSIALSNEIDLALTKEGLWEIWVPSHTPATRTEPDNADASCIYQTKSYVLAVDYTATLCLRNLTEQGWHDFWSHALEWNKPL